MEKIGIFGKKNSVDADIIAPSGAPIWNSPTIDPGRGLLYVGTGESYSSPAAPTSDAVLAFSLKTGELMWHQQLLAGDAWNHQSRRGGAQTETLRRRGRWRNKRTKMAHSKLQN